MTTHIYCVLIIACFQVQSSPSTFLKVSLHLYCYSVGATNITIEDYAVGWTVVILTVLYSYQEGNTKIKRLDLFSDVGIQLGSHNICGPADMTYWKFNSNIFQFGRQN